MPCRSKTPGRTVKYIQELLVALILGNNVGHPVHTHLYQGTSVQNYCVTAFSNLTSISLDLLLSYHCQKVSLTCRFCGSAWDVWYHGQLGNSLFGWKLYSSQSQHWSIISTNMGCTKYWTWNCSTRKNFVGWWLQVLNICIQLFSLYGHHVCMVQRWNV